MSRRSLSHLSAKALRRLLSDVLTRDRSLTAELLHVLAEVDRRRLWAEAGYSSLYAFCVGELGFSEDAAFKRMRAARLARRFPIVLDMVADGRLHLSALVLLHPHITSRNATELLSLAVQKTKREIRAMLAEHFPQRDVPTVITPLATLGEFRQLAPGPVGEAVTCWGATLPVVAVGRIGSAAAAPELAPGPVGAGGTCGSSPTPELAPGLVGVRGDPPAACSRVAALAPERYALQLTMPKALHDKLRYAQELLSHSMPGAEIPSVLELALDALIAKLEKTRFAATDRPRTQNSGSSRRPARSRHIPARVKREVWKRDQGRCAFVSESGRRCESREHLEYDHVEPVAKGGESTTVNVRLLCRAHNQLEAGRAFGEGYMHEIRERARAAASGPVAPAPGEPLSCAPAHAAAAASATPCP
jgi:hypothetical protein